MRESMTVATRAQVGMVVVALQITMVMSSHADEWEDSGHLKYQFNQRYYPVDAVAAQTAGRAQSYHQANLRYVLRQNADLFHFQADYALTYLLSNEEIFAEDPDNLDTHKALDLSKWIFTDTQKRVEQKLDRFWLGYADDRWVVNLGRQAITWGNGLNFHPMDIVNPFSPNAFDKDYKNGEDMIFVQRSFEDGGDGQIIVVPRRGNGANEIEAARSTAAAKYRFSLSFLDIDALLARHYNDNVIGVGIVRSVGTAVLRADGTFTRAHDENIAVTGVVNMDYSWTFIGYNIYSYGEYYYQSVGVKESREIYSAALTDRLQRGEIFVSGEHYLAAGLLVELSPLLHMSPALIMNLRDQSAMIPVNFTYSVRQNWNLLFGANLHLGAKDTEFGGVTVPGTNTVSAMPQQAYVQVARYF